MSRIDRCDTGRGIVACLSLVLVVSGCLASDSSTRSGSSEAFLAVRIQSEFVDSTSRESAMSRARDMVGCDPCSIMEREDAFGREETFVLSEDAYATIESDRDIATVVVSEIARLNPADGRFFAVELRLKKDSTSSLRETRDLVPLFLATTVAGRVIGVEPVLNNSESSLRVASAITRDEAVAVGRLFGSVSIETINESEEQGQRARQRRSLAEAYRVNRCDPDSAGANAQRAEYERLLAVYPDLPDWIDCGTGGGPSRRN